MDKPIKKNEEGKTEKLKTKRKSVYVKKGNNGGARPNSGRKLKLKAEARELFYSLVDERWPKIIEKLDYYIEVGDKDILRFIIEQRIGKAPQAVELSGKDGGAIEITTAKKEVAENLLKKVL